MRCGARSGRGAFPSCAGGIPGRRVADRVITRAPAIFLAKPLARLAARPLWRLVITAIPHPATWRGRRLRPIPGAAAVVTSAMPSRAMPCAVPSTTPAACVPPMGSSRCRPSRSGGVDLRLPPAGDCSVVVRPSRSALGTGHVVHWNWPSPLCRGAQRQAPPSLRAIEVSEEAHAEQHLIACRVRAHAPEHPRERKRPSRTHRTPATQRRTVTVPARRFTAVRHPLASGGAHLSGGTRPRSLGSDSMKKVPGILVRSLEEQPRLKPEHFCPQILHPHLTELLPHVPFDVGDDDAVSGDVHRVVRNAWP